ncbi:MAG TPA: CRISPR-associated endonuclease Cas2 [Sedimenticola sp.]|nr:CRISPR-associated endonuclease Cas2 [Sedimenticola sp.]
MKYYLVCFDIRDHRYRRRLARLLEGYGERVQYSVFELALRRDAQLHELLASIRALQQRHHETGNIRFYRLTLSCREASFTLDGSPVARFPGLVVA